MQVQEINFRIEAGQHSKQPEQRHTLKQLPQQLNTQTFPAYQQGRQTEQTSFMRRNNCTTKVSYGTEQCFGHHAASRCSQPCENKLVFSQCFQILQLHPPPLPCQGYFLAAVQDAYKQDNTATYCLNLYYPLLSPFRFLALFLYSLFLLLLLLKSRGWPGLWYLGTHSLRRFSFSAIIPTPMCGPLPNFPPNNLGPSSSVGMDCPPFCLY